LPLTPAELRRRFARGPLILDGAMGTELERQGVCGPAPLWSAQALLTAPAVVEAIHREYVAAGADVIVANTFRTNPRALRRAGLLADGPRLNQLAVALARAACHGRVGREGVGLIVAASIGPVEDCYSPELVPSEAELRDEHEQTASWLAAAKPDLAWIETIGTVREARAAAAVCAAAGLPLAISFVVRETGDLLSGEPLAAALAAVEPYDPLVIGLNCIPPRGLSVLLPRLRVSTSRPLAVYAHINNPTPLRGWSCSQHVTPDEYATYARDWLAGGATIIGGCCGTSAAHIAALCRIC
jgi:S-methylmethionine-dependent homocysteine/selenocysteine methylase